MTDWRRAQELFDAAAALAPDARDRLLRERAGDDHALAALVASLADADAAPPDALDGTAGDLLAALRDEPPADALVGAAFGAYRVEAHLASGGMAHVYRATRTVSGAARRVALKVLRAGDDADGLVARFRAEQHTLAALEHPHVVAFQDAGVLPDGRPYLAMEYVDGVPITDRVRGLPARERVALFLRVLAAVQHAHGRLLVHRDIKPSNVLVTADGVPKLLDFGVAAALGAGGRAPFTPGYASPEVLAGEPATTASDVWSLGVLLRELTADVPCRDLDAIVAKATAPAPPDRYRSADHMAADLRRHLAHEPVAARPATLAYRAARFVRRRRVPLALAAALAAGWTASELGRRAAAEEAGLGWRAHAQARLAARLFEASLADAPGAAERLERAVADELADHPETEAIVRIALAELLLERGERARAAVHAERALHLARTTRGLAVRDRERAEALVARARAP